MTVKFYCKRCRKYVLAKRLHDNFTDEDVFTCPDCGHDVDETNIDLDDRLPYDDSE